MNWTIHKGIFLSILVQSAVSAATIPDPAKFNRAPTPLRCDENFNSGTTGWNLGKNGFKLSPTSGINGSPALIADCPNGTFPSAAFPIKVRAGAVYSVTLKYRGENIVPKDSSKRRNNFILASIYTYDKNGKALKGQNIWTPNNFTGAFQSVNGTVTIPAEARENALLKLHFDWWHNGRIYFDDIRIVETGAGTVIQPIAPSNLCAGPDGRVAFRVCFPGGNAIPAKELVLLLEYNGKRLSLTPDADGVWEARLGSITRKTAIKAILLDLPRKRLLDEYTGTVFPPRSEAGSPCTTIDDLGRVNVNGKPFLPIGFFTYQRMSDQDYVRLRDNGFNFVSFGIRAVNLDGRNSNSTTEMKKMFDGLREYGLMGILQFTLMIPQKEYLRKKFEGNFDGCQDRAGIVARTASTVKNHPAMLGYYLADENQRSELPDISALRTLVAENDPNHFSIVLSDRKDNFPFFVPAGDVLCYDSYPFGWHDPAAFVETDRSLAALKAMKTPFWFCSQAFDWKLLEGKRGQWPSRDEILALPLLAVIYGAKGFYFFSYHEIFTKGPKVAKDFPTVFWPRVAEAGKLLSELTPFILSSRKPPQLKLNLTGGTVRAGILTNDKSALAIPVVGVSKGKNTAKLILPPGQKYYSRYGKSKKLDDGSWLFSVNGPGCDLIMSKPAEKAAFAYN